MLSPESTLHERYRITYVVDERPDGVIYRAIDNQQSMRVLIAELPQPTEAALKNVQLLAEQIVGVNTPGLLPLRDHFTQGLTTYLVADDPGGQDLERVARDRGGPLAEHEVLTYIDRLLGALDTLHNRTPPLLLGDLRPTDLWSSLDGGLFLAPFALARYVNAEPSPYRAPELHDAQAEPNTSSDSYAIGAVLYQLLTGWAPPTAAQRQAGTPLNSPRLLNARVSALAEQLALRALELKPANRYQQAQEMRSALETVRLMAGRPLGAMAPIEGMTRTVQPGVVPPPPPNPVPVSPPPAVASAETAYGPPPPAPPPTQPQVSAGAAQPAATAQWSAPAAAAPPRRQGFYLSNGCLVAIVAALAVVALVICVAGAGLLYFGIARGGILSLLPGQVAATSAPAAAEPGANQAPGADSGANTGPSSLAQGTVYTQTRQIVEPAIGAGLYAPDGSLIAVGVGSEVLLRDGETLEAKSSFSGHTGDVGSLAFSPDGAMLASGAEDDNVIRLWDVPGNRELRTLEGHTGWIRSLAFSPDGELLASSSTDLTIRLWNSASGELVRTLEGHTAWLGGITWSADGATLASASRDGTVRLWDVAAGRERSEFSYTAPEDALTGQPFWLTGVSFSPDGATVAVGSVSGSVYLLDTTNGELQRELAGHESWVIIRGVSYSPDGEQIASASLDGTVRLWNARSGAERGVLEQSGLRLMGISWHPDSARLATTSDTAGSLTIWEVAAQKVERSALLSQGVVTALTYSDNGTALATGGVNGSVRLHNLAEQGQISLSGGASTNQYLGFLSDTQLVAVSDGGAVVVIDLENQAQNKQLEGLDGLALNLSVSRDRRLIAAGNERGEIALWDARSFELLRTLSGLDGPIYALSFNRDASELAAVTNDPAEQPKLGVWDVQSGDRKSTFSGHGAPVTALEMPADQGVVASASNDGSLKIWQADNGEEQRTLSAEPDEFFFSSLTFSPDGSLLVTGALSGEVVFWNPENGERLSEVELAAGPVLALTFRPDGAQLAVSTRDGGVYLLEPNG